MPSKNTFALDSTALVLPYIIRKDIPPVYRCLLTLYEEIDPVVLTQAVRDLAPRFPFMYTRLRRGFIWDRLEEVPACAILEKDDGRLCRPFDYRGEEPLIRVVYRKNELGLEFTHFTNDGTSGTVYLFSLAARYFELRGHAVEKNRFILDYRDTPSQAELTDAFRMSYGKPEKRIRQIVPPAFQGPGERQDGYLRVTTAQIPIDAMKTMLKEKYGGCTITEYLTAVYALAYLRLYEKSDKRRPVRLEVPGNLRQHWDTDTLRNFSAIANINAVPDKAEYGFDDILEHVRREMQENLTKDKMQAFIYQNVRYLKLLSVIPGFVKRAAFLLGFPLLNAMWPITSSMSNPGYFRLPDSLAEHIRYYETIMGRYGTYRVVGAAAGIKNTLSITFSAFNESTEIQDFCIGFWERDELSVQVFERRGQAK